MSLELRGEIRARVRNEEMFSIRTMRRAIGWMRPSRESSSLEYGPESTEALRQDHAW